MGYRETLDFMYRQLPAYHRIGKAAYKNDLHNTLEFDKYLGHPHRRYHTIHIAGTNGKGSVSNMLASVLMEAGYKTGLYTSPHLKDFRERITINGKMIGKQRVTEFVRNNSSFIDSLKPSFFEMTVAMAFDFFADEEVDVAVIEVGLGGRLDSTNIITPVLSVITNIGHDHMDLLGNSLEEIAAEKAGIIKKGVPVVIGETQPETRDIFLNRAETAGSEIFFADSLYLCDLKDYDYRKGASYYVIRDRTSATRLEGEIPLGGIYQSKNLLTLYQTCRALKTFGRMNDDTIRKGIRNVIRNTHFSGRWQVLGKRPLTICDTGHNLEGLNYVVNQINRIDKNRLHMVIGFVNDKDLELVLPVLPADACYYFTKASVPRAMDEKKLMTEACRAGLKGESYPDVPSAVRAAQSYASADDLIFIGGSTFVVAEAL